MLGLEIMDLFRAMPGSVAQGLMSPRSLRLLDGMMVALPRTAR